MKVENGAIEFLDEVKTSEKPKSNLSLIIITLMVGLGVGFWIGNRANESVLDYSSLDEVYSVLNENYDGEIDTELLLEGAKKGMVSGLGDSYTQYFTRIDAKEFTEDIEGEFFGVGIELNNRDGHIVIVDVLDETPAQKIGLQEKDIIIKVDDTDVSNWASEEAVKIIRGEIGSKVKLTVLRSGSEQEFEITRAKISNPSVKAQIIDNIGVLSISRFGETDTITLAKQAARNFVDKGVKGVVLDLRGNSGGYVSVSVEIASLWVKKGEVVTSEKRGQIISDTEHAIGGNILADLETVVLIDGGSASASEIVAGALRDYDLATIIGTQSFGKGSVQVLRPLSNGDQIKITMARWFTPNGQNIDQEGITPDEEIEFDVKKYQNGEDVQLNRALDILKN